MQCTSPQGKQTYPYLPELDESGLLELQWGVSRQHGMDVHFHDTVHGHAGPELMVIPPGTIEIGSSPREFGHHDHEGPQRLAAIERPYALGRFTVTASEWQRFMDDTGWQFRPDLIFASGKAPVMNLRLADAEAYCSWLSELSGARYRLPTEQEWEYACRAGTTSAFSFGDSVTCKEVHFNAAFPYQELKEKRRWFLPRCMPMPKAIEVGTKHANTWGLHEMHGNVWELTSSSWSESHKRGERAFSKWIVTKGGSWFDAAVFARSASRMKRLRDELDVNLGFRVLREL